MIAENTWAALKGREKLKVDWSAGPWANESTSALAATANGLLDKNTGGVVVRNDGDIVKARKQAASKLEARYEMPFLAHVPMETLGALISVEAGQGAADRVAAAARPRVDDHQPDHRRRAQGHRHPPHARRRQFRTSPEKRFRRRSRADRQGGEETGQAAVDARGRHPARRLSPVRHPRDGGDVRQEEKDHRLVAPLRRDAAQLSRIRHEERSAVHRLPRTGRFSGGPRRQSREDIFPGEFRHAARLVARTDPQFPRVRGAEFHRRDRGESETRRRAAAARSARRAAQDSNTKARTIPVSIPDVSPMC